jgi:hypothetical protein
MSGVHLLEPDTRRATFHARYAIPNNMRDKRNLWPRLAECCICIRNLQAIDYMAPAADGEFVVVDVVTREKAWFEWPEGMPAGEIGRIVEGHFDSAAFRVGERIWFV